MNKKAGAAAGKRREKQTGRRRSQSERLLPNDVADIKVADEVGDSLAEQAFRENDDKMDEEEDSLDRFAREWGLTREDVAPDAGKPHLLGLDARRPIDAMEDEEMDELQELFLGPDAPRREQDDGEVDAEQDAGGDALEQGASCCVNKSTKKNQGKRTKNSKDELVPTSTKQQGAAAAAKLHQAKEPKKASRLACISLRTSNKMNTSKSLPSSTMKKNAKKNKPATKMKQAPRDVGASSGLLVGVRKGKNKDKKMKNASAASGRGTNQAQTTTSKTTGSRMKMKSSKR